MKFFIISCVFLVASHFAMACPGNKSCSHNKSGKAHSCNHKSKDKKHTCSHDKSDKVHSCDHKSKGKKHTCSHDKSGKAHSCKDSKSCKHHKKK